MSTYEKLRKLIGRAIVDGELAAEYNVKADHWEEAGDGESAKVAREEATAYRRLSDDSYEQALTMIEDLTKEE